MRLVVLIYLILIVPASAQITFSEIMFDVSTNEYHDEFVELYNLSYTDSLTVAGWKFSDSSGTDLIIPVNSANKIAPRGFAVLLDGSYFGNSTTYDSLLPGNALLLKIADNAFGGSGLSNSNPEYLSIIDSTGDTLTSYRYSINNGAGYSDEKIILDSSSDISAV